MISIDSLTKRYRGTTAVSELSFSARPGAVTALLGPNGAGKSTTLRILLGLEQPDGGTATFDGVPYRSMREPMRSVGALLDAGWVHPLRTVSAHLRWMAQSNGIPRERIGEVLEIVGLQSVAGRRCGKLSLGMRQRVGLAGALLGDPDHLILDEPANGLDPEGVQWIRAFMRRFADSGRVVLMSSHMLGEVEQSCDEVVVIARGSARYTGGIEQFTARGGSGRVRVRAAEPERLAAALAESGMVCSDVVAGARGPEFTVEDSDEQRVAEAAAAAGLLVFEISAERSSVEEAFFREVGDGAEFRGRL
ncbi:ABC transporter ATP-binding protein [Rathayibacter sp. AY1A3]|uniref:ABC transporter ATP-binding protein n=1 Tax=Rathayibacter sp. AY1A3 TaxID=2080521 RepID=UPI000CE89798|nr:ATP-binding cassette domain-containing protein [Rathayibacter sp. AY1A3]PPF30702.1 export ABC transporter ATP-binding protein [Rathayibacter sp. AY1A3]